METKTYAVPASLGNEPAGRHKTKDQFIEAGTEPRCCVLSEVDLWLPSGSLLLNNQSNRDRGQVGPVGQGALILSPSRLETGRETECRQTGL